MVGAAAANAAFLIVQHNGSLQHEMLRLMLTRPAGELSSADLAMLEDPSPRRRGAATTLRQSGVVQPRQTVRIRPDRGHRPSRRTACESRSRADVGVSLHAARGVRARPTGSTDSAWLSSAGASRPARGPPAGPAPCRARPAGYRAIRRAQKVPNPFEPTIFRRSTTTVFLGPGPVEKRPQGEESA